MKLPRHRKPTHPGEMLLEEFLKPQGITQKEFAEHLGWTYTRLNEIVNGRRGVTADSALAFSEAFGGNPEFWLNLQAAWDLWEAQQKHRKVLPFKVMNEKSHRATLQNFVTQKDSAVY